MPNLVTIAPSKSSLYKVEDSLCEGFLAWAYPGKFVGFGPTRVDALIMVQLRYRNTKKRYLDKGETDASWVAYAKDRESKMDAVYEKWGVRENSTWSEDSIEKKVE